MSKVIYLAGPIDQGGKTNEARVFLMAMRTDAKSILIGLGAAVFDPAHAWSVPKGEVGGENQVKGVAHINFAAIDHAHGLLALLPEDAPTIGTPIEVAYALARGIPTAMIGKAAENSWMVHALASSRLKIFPGVEIWNLQGLSLACRWLMDQDYEPAQTLKYVGQEPYRHYEGDAGWDIAAKQDFALDEGTYLQVESATRIQLPPGVWGLLVGRSSMEAKRQLRVMTAVIDQGYRGPIIMTVHNHGPGPRHVLAGERIAQIVPLPMLAPDIDLREVVALDESDRGDARTGSTGRGGDSVA